MSYRDLEVDVAEMVPAHLPLGLVVHSPDLFPGDHILNLASEDDRIVIDPSRSSSGSSLSRENSDLTLRRTVRSW